VQKQMNASLLNLHEDEVPQFEDVGIILVDKSGGISGRKMNRCDQDDSVQNSQKKATARSHFEAAHFAAPATSNAVVVDLGAWSARAGFAHFPEVVLGTEESVR
jgi:hypothetical protein